VVGEVNCVVVTVVAMTEAAMAEEVVVVRLNNENA
jgi:hypothetical protein